MSSNFKKPEPQAPDVCSHGVLGFCLNCQAPTEGAPKHLRWYLRKTKSNTWIALDRKPHSETYIEVVEREAYDKLAKDVEFYKRGSSYNQIRASLCEENKTPEYKALAVERDIYKTALNQIIGAIDASMYSKGGIISHYTLIAFGALEKAGSK